MLTNKLAGPLLGLALLLGAAAAVRAQATDFPPETAQEYASAFNAAAVDAFAKAKLIVDMEVMQARGFTLREDVGLLLIPDTKLTLPRLESGSEDLMPLGVLATLKMTLDIEEQRVTDERIYKIDIDGMEVWAFLLGVRSEEGGVRWLEFYGPNDKLVFRRRLERVQPVDDQLLLLNLEGYDANRGDGQLAITIGGRREVKVPFAVVE